MREKSLAVSDLCSRDGPFKPPLRPIARYQARISSVNNALAGCFPSPSLISCVAAKLSFRLHQISTGGRVGNGAVARVRVPASVRDSCFRWFSRHELFGREVRHDAKPDFSFGVRRGDAVMLWVWNHHSIPMQTSERIQRFKKCSASDWSNRTGFEVRVL